MSSYGALYVNDKEIFTYRNGVYPDTMYLFSEDEFLRLKGRDALPYSSHWRGAVTEEDIEDTEIYIYRVPTFVLKDRLELLGFGEQLTRKTVEGIVESQIRRNTEMLANLPDLEYLRYEIDELEHFDYESWKNKVSEYITAKRSSQSDEPNTDTDLLSLVAYADERILLRVIVDLIARDDSIVLDISELVEAGYTDVNESTGDEWQSSWALGSSPPIIITEGSYDARVLRGAIEILKPHLASYVRFLDYDVGNEGGAVAAVKTLKSFAAAGVSNRIVAIFDNDSAAYEAVMGLRGSKLPPQYAVMHYPDLELANAYPTLGPQGNIVMNVNRLAGSIELYLGEDVLTSQDGRLTPVQWKGYMGKIGAYQGEVMNKAALQSAFRDKLKAAKADPAKIGNQDWSGLELVLNNLIETLSKLSSISRTLESGLNTRHE